jgi:hypothetical protein
MGNPIAVRPCCNVMAVKIVPAPFDRPRTNGRIRVTAARARRGRFTVPLRTLSAADGAAAYAPYRPLRLHGRSSETEQRRDRAAIICG